MKPIARDMLHDMNCRCADCPTERQAAEHLSTNDLCLIGIAGFIVGLILVALLDWITAGPGVIPELGI